MKRHIHRVLCAFGCHQWFSPLPWHGAFAAAWKRCRWCGREEGSEMSLGEYRAILDSITYGDGYDTKTRTDP